MTVCDLLSGPEKWCQGPSARDANGDVTASNSPTACSWCIQGAIWKVYKSWDEQVKAEEKLEAVLKKRKKHPSFVRFNEKPGRKFSTIRRLIEEAGI